MQADRSLILSSHWLRAWTTDAGLSLVLVDRRSGKSRELTIEVTGQPQISLSECETPWWGLGVPQGHLDVFRQLLEWVEPSENGAREPILYAELLALARHAATRCDPTARGLALRFNPAARFELYSLFVADRTNRLKELAETCPGALLLIVGLRTSGLNIGEVAAERLVDDIVAGRRLNHAIDEAVTTRLSGKAAPRSPQLSLPFPAAIDELPLEERLRVARVRLLVRNAGTLVDPTLSLRTPPVVVPEDIPRDPHANARWYSVMSECAALTSRRERNEELNAAFTRFVSKNIPGVRTRLSELYDYLEATRRIPTRETSVPNLIEDSNRWHQGMAEVRDAVGLAQEMGIAPDGILDVAFPAPPLPGMKAESWSIRPIRTVRRLIEEGREMHHCVASRASHIVAGRSYIYSAAIAGQRLTVEVMPGGAGQWRLGDVCGVANRRPTEAKWRAIGRWVATAGEQTYPTEVPFMLDGEQTYHTPVG